MLLTPTEFERLTLFSAAELARKHKAKGLRLNHPEAVALIVDEILEGAREGRMVADLIAYGSKILTQDDVLPGISYLIPMLQVEASFPDGTKLVTIHEPIRPGKEPNDQDAIIPGEIITGPENITLNKDRQYATVHVTNTGDRPIQVGSHFHFFEANKELEFDRSMGFGMHLDVPAGTAVRFEPGDEKEVALVAFGGTREIFGLNGLTNAALDNEGQREKSLNLARQSGFRGAQ